MPPHDPRAPAGTGAETVRPSRAFDVFLSYSQQDAAVVERIAERLKRDGLEPWLDRWCLKPGGRWQEEIADALGESAACAVFIGGDLGAWEREEMELAMDQAATRPGFRVFAVLLPGVDPLGAGALPPFLRIRMWVDLRAGPYDARGLDNLARAVRGIPFGPAVPIEPEVGVAPYRGLEVFEEEHARYFFGRDGDVQRLVERLRHGRFVAVLGASGSGKSSLVRAGLVPALRGALPLDPDRRIPIVRPGTHPLESLAAAAAAVGDSRGAEAILADLWRGERGLHLAVQFALSGRPADERAVLVVDQLEEAFTLCEDARERARAFDNLVYAASRPGGRCVVVVTLRADFYPWLAEHRALALLVEDTQELVGPLGRDQLRQVIEAPARLAGLDVEPGLAATIMGDAGHDPGALPLLEHALLETWTRRHGTTLSLDGYRESGGVEGALAQRADAVYGELAPDRQEQARQLLLRLTQPGEGVADTRRRAPLAELLDAGDQRASVEDVIARFTQARLLTASGGASGAACIEVAHEALIRGWPRLQAWIDDSRRGLVIQRRLTDAAREWADEHRDRGWLYRGSRLAEARAAEERGDLWLNPLERQFLIASIERDHRARRARRRRLAVAFAALGAGIVAIGAVAIVAVNARRDAVNERNAALSRQLAIQASTALGADPALGLDLAIEAFDLDANQLSETALRQATLAQRQLAILQADSETAQTVAVSPDGTIAVSGGDDGVARLWDLADRRRRTSFVTHHGPLQAARFSHDGTHVALGFHDGTVIVTDAGLADPRSVLHVLRAPIWDVAFGADDERLAVAVNDGTVRLVATDGTGPRRRLAAHRGPANGVDVSPDGSRLVTAGEDGSVRLWNALTRQPIRVLRSAGSWQRAVRFSPDGTRVIAVGEDGLIRLWNRAGEGRIVRIPGEGRELRTVAFSPDGDRFAASGQDGVIRVWSVVGDAPVAVLRGQRSRVMAVGFAGGDDRLISAGDDGTMRIWDTGRTVVWQTPTDTQGLDFDHDGGRLVSADGAGSVSVWNAASGDRTAFRRGPGGYTTAKFSPTSEDVVIAGPRRGVHIWLVGSDRKPRVIPTKAPLWAARFDASGDRLVFVDYRGRVVVRDIASHEKTLRGGPTTLYDAAISSDGQRVAAAGSGGVVFQWSLRDPTAPERLTGHRGNVNDLAFNQYGQLVTAGADRTVRVWDPDRTRSTVLSGHDEDVTTAAFTADGRRVVSASQDGTARLWDGAGGDALAVLETGANALFDVAVSRDGRIATLDSNYLVRVFACEVCGSVDDVRALAAKRVIRALTADEKRRYLNPER